MEAGVQVRAIWWALVVGGLAYTCALIGLLGTGEYALDLPGVTKLLYHAAGVLAFEEPDTAPEGSPVYAFARPLTLMFAAFAATGVVLEVFGPVRETSMRFLLWLGQTFRPPSVVIGLGWIGGPLVSQLRSGRRPVIAVGIDDDSPKVDEASRQGALVMIGDVTEAAMRERIPFQFATEVFVATGDDARNVEVAGALLEAAQAWRRPPGRGPLHCYVHLESSEREQALGRHGFWANHGPSIELHAFSQPELVARDLFFHPRQGIGIDTTLQPVPKSDEPFHLFVFGFGPTGRAIARHLGRFGHFGSLRRPRLTVFTAEPQAEFAEFLQRHPGFSPAGLDLSEPVFRTSCADRWEQRHGRPVVERYRIGSDNAVEYAVNAEVIELAENVQSDRVTGAILDRLRPVDGSVVRAAVVLCFEEDRLSFEAALNLQHALFNAAAESDASPEPVPIYVYLPVELGLARVIGAEGQEEPDTPGASFPLRPFGARDVVASYERITMPMLRVHATQARTVYERLEPGRRQQLHPDFLASNFDAAQHAIIKLSALGIHLTDPGVPAPPMRPRVLGSLLSPEVDDKVARVDLPGLDDAKFAELDRAVQQRLALVDVTRKIDPKLLEAAIDAAVDDFESALRAVGRDPYLVARMEHNRWMGERLTAGWRYGERSNLLRKRPSMVPFDQLDAHDQRHDRIDLVRFLVQEWAWGRAAYFVEDPALAGSTLTTGTPRRSA